MTSCVGFEGRRQFVYQKDGQYYAGMLGQWVDKYFEDNASKIVNVDADGAVQRIMNDDPSFKMWATDQVGLPLEQTVTYVQRTDTTKLPPGWRVLRFRCNRDTYDVGSDTLVCTRLDNQVSSQPASSFDASDPGCMVACNLWGWQIGRDGIPMLTAIAVQPGWDVPNVLTATWGLVHITRADAMSLIEVCDNYPDAVDPGDRAVFDGVLTEMIYYDRVNTIDDMPLTGSKYLYYFDTEWGNHHNGMSGTLAGVPHISPLSNPVREDKLEKAKAKGTANVKDILASFKKDQ